MTDSAPTRFTDPLPGEDIDWRVQRKKKGDNTKGWAVPYIDVDTARRRLEEVCDGNGWSWSNAYVVLPDGKHVECQITIHRPDGAFTRSDVGQPGRDTTDADPMKSCYSDAFKRAAQMWGVGRQLHEMKEAYVTLNEWGQIDPESWKRLRKLTGAPADTATPASAEHETEPAGGPAPQDGRIAGDQAWISFNKKVEELGYNDQTLAEIARGIVINRGATTRSQLQELIERMKKAPRKRTTTAA